MSACTRCMLGACLAAVAACASVAADKSAPPLSLEGPRWVMGGPKSDAESMPRLEFTREGRVSGFTGCNRLSGSYRLDEDRLEVMAATTKRACPGPGGEAEQKLLAVLADRPRVRIEGSRLLLTGASGATFAMESAAP
jgi:heat shock protein HslJ